MFQENDSLSVITQVNEFPILDEDFDGNISDYIDSIVHESL